ncbi:MAG: tRNA (adenosine(37)-N6)-threonylcarbamoyltransferase complex ATPase subunit type 1 TsaE [Burkholderiales bacterium]
MTLHLKLPDEAATLALGAALAAGARPGLVLYLSGELGAGKTTLVRGLLRALGYPGRVKSPTYTLVEPYAVSRLDLYHFDFYRFKDETEWVSSGFREYFNPDTLCVVEWPEKAANLLAPADLVVTMQISGELRHAILDARSAAGRSWLASAQPRLPSAPA